MKYTLSITQICNLACTYCYIDKEKSTMPLTVADRVVDFIYQNTPIQERLDIGFFGGEPLLEFDLLKQIVDKIQDHKSFDPGRVILSIVSNGTLFSRQIAEFLQEKNISLCISCDGPPLVHDVFRRFTNGKGSSAQVEHNIKAALEFFPLLPVNAVYSPENVHCLPEVVDYFASLGIKNIYLNPNISAHWTKNEADLLPGVYSAIAQRYMDFYQQEEPRHISLIDSKIAVILRKGYKSCEKCRMGLGELAFTPSGNVYPCERFIGADDRTHSIGNINDGFVAKSVYKTQPNLDRNTECESCGIKDYCMNWCGCTNYFGTGRYNRVSPFICAAEKAAAQAALQVIETMGEEGLNFSDHLAGTPLMSIVGETLGEFTLHRMDRTVSSGFQE